MDEAAIPVNVGRALEGLKRRLAARFGPAFIELRLFGSYARGEQHDESDVDVVLLFAEELDPDVVRALFDDVTQVELKEGLVISPKVWSVAQFRRMAEEEQQIALDIEEQGIRA